MLGVVLRKAFILMSKKWCMIFSAGDQNKASEPFLKGFNNSNFLTRISMSLIWNPPFHWIPTPSPPPPPLPMDENSAGSWKLFLKGTAVLAHLIFGIYFWRVRVRKKIPFFSEGKGNRLIRGGGEGGGCVLFSYLIHRRRGA